MYSILWSRLTGHLPAPITQCRWGVLPYKGREPCVVHCSSTKNQYTDEEPCVQCLLEPINRWEEPCALLFNSLSPYKEKEKRESAAVHSWARESKWLKKRHSLLCCWAAWCRSEKATLLCGGKVEGFPRFEIDFWWLIHGVRGMLFACKSPSHHAISQCCWIHHPTLHSSWLGAYCLVGVEDGRVWPIARKISRLGLVSGDCWWWLVMIASDLWHQPIIVCHQRVGHTPIPLLNVGQALFDVLHQCMAHWHLRRIYVLHHCWTYGKYQCIALTHGSNA